VTNLSHTASFHSNERITPSNRGIKQFVKDGLMVCINVSGLKAEALAKMDIRAVWSS
jgi:hypothetical protein